VAAPIRLGVEFRFPHQTDRAFLIPGTTRRTGTRLDYVADDMVTAIRAFRAMVALAGE
jgi:D-aminopeptidase